MLSLLIPLGIRFLSLGIFGGSAILRLFELMPFPVLGVLMYCVVIPHIPLVKELHGWQAWITAMSVVLLACFTKNLAIGFGIETGIYFGFRGILTLQKGRNSQREINGR